MKTRVGSWRALILGAVLTLPFALVALPTHAQDASPSGGSAVSQQQSAEPEEPGAPVNYGPPRKSLAERTLEDAGAYYTAPLHWNGRDWEYFGGALAAIAVAHHYDTQARTHFDQGSKSPLGPKETGAISDA